MFSRFRTALGLALTLALLTSITAFAKGSFSFITVTGADLKGEIRLSDPNLTLDFFTFADFYRDRTDAPADPGVGYEITRYYVDGTNETAFDKLHYYAETGYVYYDGIVNGSSEYDDKWYSAAPEIKSTFESALNTELRLIGLREPGAAQAMVPPAQVVEAPAQAQPATASTPAAQPMLLALLALGLAILLAFALWFRKPMLDKQPKGG